MRRIAAITRNPVAIALVAMLAVAGCAGKNTPNNAADLGLGGAGAGAATPGSTQDFTVNVGDRVFFDTDSSLIRADAQQTLARQAQWLNRYAQYSITVEGHADERGTREYNLGLGERRGNAVSGALQGAGGSAGQITVVSYGEERPVCTESNESCWQRNRRVEIVYTVR